MNKNLNPSKNVTLFIQNKFVDEQCREKKNTIKLCKKNSSPQYEFEILLIAIIIDESNK